jgi:hypothetical protein
MTREERRKVMPTCAEWIDEMREHFPELRVLYARENQHTWGESEGEGVPLTPTWRGE